MEGFRMKDRMRVSGMLGQPQLLDKGNGFFIKILTNYISSENEEVNTVKSSLRLLLDKIMMAIYHL